MRSPPELSWLAEPSPAAVTDALRAAAPELAGLPIALPDLAGGGLDDPVFHSSSAALGEEYIAKFAWSQPAARRVRTRSSSFPPSRGTRPPCRSCPRWSRRAPIR